MHTLQRKSVLEILAKNDRHLIEFGGRPDLSIVIIELVVASSAGRLQNDQRGKIQDGYRLRPHLYLPGGFCTAEEGLTPRVVALKNSAYPSKVMVESLNGIILNGILKGGTVNRTQPGSFQPMMSRSSITTGVLATRLWGR